MDMGARNGIRGLKVVGREELLRLEPNLDPDAKFGLYNPNTGVVNSFQLTLAMAENAALNGVRILRNAQVTAIHAQNGRVASVETTAGIFEPKVVINSAGLYSDKIAAMAEEVDFSIKPRRGQYFLYDREWSGHVRHCIYSSPTKTSKGMILVPTTEGNILAGSNAISVDDREDTATTRQEMDGIYRDLIHRHFPKLPRYGEVVTSFVGLRSASDTEDFIIAHAKTVRGLINLVGIQSPGLSSSVGIAEMVEGLAREACDGLDFTEKENYLPGRPKPVVFRDMSNDERDEMIAKNPDYGVIVCRCETVSKGEMLDALRGPVPAMDLDGIKRRVRAGMGRCQGGFCGPKAMGLLCQEMNVPMLGLSKKGPGSHVLAGRVKDLSLLKGRLS
jgi:glycerol-3-phosphate dehydrogenase